MKDLKNIMEHALDLYNKSGEGNTGGLRNYGPMTEAINETAQVVSIITGKTITPDDVTLIYFINKLIRNRTGKKYDNILDGLVYLAQLYRNDPKEYDKTMLPGQFEERQKESNNGTKK